MMKIYFILLLTQCTHILCVDPSPNLDPNPHSVSYRIQPLIIKVIKSGFKRAFLRQKASFLQPFACCLKSISRQYGENKWGTRQGNNFLC